MPLRRPCLPFRCSSTAPTPAPSLLYGVLRLAVAGAWPGRWPGSRFALSHASASGLSINSELLVIKNRPELTTTGAMDSRVQFVEDYVATQVLYLKSERILEQAAKRLDNEKPFQVAPPVSEGAR